MRQVPRPMAMKKEGIQTRKRKPKHNNLLANPLTNSTGPSSAGNQLMINNEIGKDSVEARNLAIRIDQSQADPGVSGSYNII